MASNANQVNSRPFAIDYLRNNVASSAGYSPNLSQQYNKDKAVNGLNMMNKEQMIQVVTIGGIAYFVSMYTGSNNPGFMAATSALSAVVPSATMMPSIGPGTDYIVSAGLSATASYYSGEGVIQGALIGAGSSIAGKIISPKIVSAMT
jgi:hypothetical protein